MSGRFAKRVFLALAMAVLISGLSASGAYAADVTRIDDLDPAIVYQPGVSTTSNVNWLRWPVPPNNVNYHAGGYTNARNAGRLATIAFTGTGVDWITVKAPNQGLAEVWVDSEAPVQVDLYAAANAYQQVVWSKRGLSNGPHTLNIQALGANRAGEAAGSNTLVGIDAIDVFVEPEPVSVPASSMWSVMLLATAGGLLLIRNKRLATH
jgi:hypothetical protein